MYQTGITFTGRMGEMVGVRAVTIRKTMIREKQRCSERLKAFNVRSRPVVIMRPLGIVARKMEMVLRSLRLKSPESL